MAAILDLFFEIFPKVDQMKPFVSYTYISNFVKIGPAVFALAR